jgi:hypothetical protein
MMNESVFLDAYKMASPQDPASQAVAHERALARSAGWKSVMDRVTAGQPIDRALLNNTQDGAFSPPGAMVKVTAVTRDANGEMTGTRVVNVSCRQLEADRLRGMTDALVAVIDAQTKAGARVSERV